MTEISTMDPLAFTTVALDFDGVLHPYSKGWHDGTCYDPPVPEALALVDELMGTRPVAIMTARPLAPIGDWLERHTELSFLLDHRMQFDHWDDTTTLLVTNRKIVAAHYVDDRAIRWNPNDSWGDLANYLAYMDAVEARRHAARGLG